MSKFPHKEQTPKAWEPPPLDPRKFEEPYGDGWRKRRTKKKRKYST